jgi:hypothetical protein
MKLSRVLTFALALTGGAFSAQAAYVTGTYSFSGDLAVATSGGNTSIDFLGTGTGPGTGDGAKLGPGSGAYTSAGSVVVLTDFSFNTSTKALNSGPISPLWSVSSGAYTFVLNSLSLANITTTSINLSGSGYVTAPSFSNTVATWTLGGTKNSGDNSYVFTLSSTSASGQPVPEGSNMVLLLGSALVGAAGLSRFRRVR